MQALLVKRLGYTDTCRRFVAIRRRTGSGCGSAVLRIGPEKTARSADRRGEDMHTTFSPARRAHGVPPRVGSPYVVRGAPPPVRSRARPAGERYGGDGRERGERRRQRRGRWGGRRGI